MKKAEHDERGRRLQGARKALVEAYTKTSHALGLGDPAAQHVRDAIKIIELALAQGDADYFTENHPEPSPYNYDPREYKPEPRTEERIPFGQCPSCNEQFWTELDFNDHFSLKHGKPEPRTKKKGKKNV